MRTGLLNGCLAASAVALLAANFYLCGTTVVARTVGIAPPRTVEKSESGTVRDEPIAPPQPKPAPATSAIHWEPLESDDYPQYMSNLRNFGFPEELIRQLIMDEINSLYEPKIAPLRTKVVPPDAPAAERNRQTNAEDLTRLREWQRLLIEKRSRLEGLLGVNVPREIIRTPISRNYDAHEYAIGRLPPEKQEAAMELIENQWLLGETLSAYPERLREYGFNSQTEAYSGLYAQRDAGLQKILSAEEFRGLMMNIMPSGTELQREIIGMEATDKELVGLYGIADELWAKNGGVYGKWRMVKIPPDQIQQNDADAEAKIQQLLGEERYADYRMARSDAGRQMNNLAARYDLPRETIRQAYSAQMELDKYTSKIPGDAHPDWEERKIALSQKLQELLGPHIFEAWESGRNQKYKIEP